MVYSILEERVNGHLTSPRSVASITALSYGVLHYHSLPTKIFAVQVVHSIICITGVIKLYKAISKEIDESYEISGKYARQICYNCNQQQKKLSDHKIIFFSYSLGYSCYPI